MAKVTASILGADFLNLEKEIKKVRNADFLHFGVMDGHFVPNHTYGAKIYKQIRERFPDILVEVHLMVEQPENFLPMFPEPYAMIFHSEATTKTGALIRKIHSSGSKVGLALNPDKDVDNITVYLEDVDLVVIMGAYAGFDRQEFLPETFEKIKKVRELFNGLIEIDCGVNGENAKAIVEAGADILVSASFLFEKNTKERLLKLKSL